MKTFIGIDVQETRGCCFGVIGEEAVVLGSGWFQNTIEDALTLVRELKNKSYDVSVGIDAPRTPLVSPRRWYWDGRRVTWRPRRRAERGYGRHCEIVVHAHGLARPQYTPLVQKTPTWMQTGFNLFSALQGIVPTYEVFPTASYALLEGVTDVQINIDFSSCRLGPKDILDSFVAAATVREFVSGQGCKVGGGDGLGEIILPRLLPQQVIEEVLVWPQDNQ